MSKLTVKQYLVAMGAQALTRGFKVTEYSARDLLVVCKSCNKRWVLSRSSQHAGNVLYLLNHEASHAQK